MSSLTDIEKQKMVSGFTPDQHTAKICFQALKVVLASAAEEIK